MAMAMFKHKIYIQPPPPRHKWMYPVVSWKLATTYHVHTENSIHYTKRFNSAKTKQFVTVLKTTYTV